LDALGLILEIMKSIGAENSSETAPDEGKTVENIPPNVERFWGDEGLGYPKLREIPVEPDGLVTFPAASQVVQEVPTATRHVQ
jgi:hypothetical protein